MAAAQHAGPGGERGLRSSEWSRRIEAALERDLFVLHGQRIVEVATGETRRHELFLRMVDRRRLIPAGEFVMTAEEFGSIREIDRWVVSRAIEVAADGWAVDLNLSLRSTDEAMLELIRHRLEESGADPSDLVLEVSESQLSAAGETRNDFIGAVTDLGCRIALDGFVEGGKDSGLLRRFPISFVKLGPTFIEGLPVDRSQRRLVGTVVLRAHRSGLKVIAQGVEDLATLQQLEELGIDEAQGYALGPPESLESLTGAAA
jgi:EAL domain-containing protein (putative c-di-GMP-specific phosphodiesterase class I)